MPLSTLLRPPELAAQLQRRGGHAPRRRPRATATARTSTTSRRSRRASPTRTARHAPSPRSRHCATCRSPASSPSRGRAGRRWSRPWKPRCGRPTTWRHVHVGQPRRAEGRDPHARQRAPRHVAPGSSARRVGPGDRLYIPMPFFWTGGFGGGLLTVLVAGATLLTEATPEPARTLAFLERERVTLFRGWPDQAARLAADPAFATADLSSLRAGQPRRGAAARRCRPRPATAPNLFGMTETFGPYCGARLDLDLPGRQARAAAGVRSPASRCASSTPKPGDAVRARRAGRDRAARLAPDARHLRPQPRATCSAPTASTPPATSARSTPTATSGTRAGSTTCSRSRARRCTRGGRGRAARHRRRAQAYVTNVTDAGGTDAGGRGRRSRPSSPPRIRTRRRGTRAAERVQGADALAGDGGAVTSCRCCRPARSTSSRSKRYSVRAVCAHDTTRTPTSGP